MEHVSCTFCKAENTELLFLGQDEWYHKLGTFPVSRCLNCGLIYLNIRPTKSEIQQYYPTQYQPYLTAIADESSFLKRWERSYGQRKLMKLIAERVNGVGQALDIGCATGIFLNSLEEKGWQVQGVDTNERAVDYARQRFGLNVFHGELDEAQFPNQSFDLVTMWNVLEHVYDPCDTLREIARIARPGSLLILTVPNPDSYEAHWFGPYWAGWDVPRHLHIFSQDIISQMLYEAGWQMTEMVCMSGRFWLLNLSLHHWLNGKTKNIHLKKFVTAITQSFIFRIITLPYFFVVEKLKKGSIMAFTAKRIDMK